jgi:hypothetical protein
MAVASVRPFSPVQLAPAGTLRGLAEDLLDLRHRLCQEHGILATDYEVLKALVETPDATKEELAVTAHASPAGYMAAIDRLHAARLAKVRGFNRRAQGGETPRAEIDMILCRVEDIRPIPTDAGRLLVAGIDGTIEATLDQVLGVAANSGVSRLTVLLEACRGTVWDVGAAPVVSVQGEVA